MAYASFTAVDPCLRRRAAHDAFATAAFLPPPKGLQKRNQLGMFRIIPQALSETQSSCAHRMRSVARQPLAQLSSP